MTFSISALVSGQDSHIKPDSEVGGLIWVKGWYQGRYGKFHVIIYLSHILHWLLFCRQDIWTHKLRKSILLKFAFVQHAHIFVSSLVSKRYQTMLISTITLEGVCKIYPRRWHLNGNSCSTPRIHLSQLFRFNFFKLIPIFWNV